MNDDIKQAALHDIFTGRFEQLLLDTNHYEVKLVTYISNETEGEPINGVEYVVEVADERVFKCDTAKEVEAIIEALYAYRRKPAKTPAETEREEVSIYVIGPATSHTYDGVNRELPYQCCLNIYDAMIKAGYGKQKVEPLSKSALDDLWFNNNRYSIWKAIEPYIIKGGE